MTRTALLGSRLALLSAWLVLMPVLLSSNEAFADSLLYPSDNVSKPVEAQATATNLASSKSRDSLLVDKSTQNASTQEAKAAKEAKEDSAVSSQGFSTTEGASATTKDIAKTSQDTQSKSQNATAFGLGSTEASAKNVYRGTEPISMGKFVVYCFGVIGLIFLLAWFLKRMRLVPGSRASKLGVITALAVGQKEKLVLVRVGDEQLLIGVTPNNVNLVYKLPNPLDETDAKNAAPNTSNSINKEGEVEGFKELFKKLKGSQTTNAQTKAQAEANDSNSDPKN